MPVIEFSIKDLEKLIGIQISREDLHIIEEQVKGEIEDVNGDRVTIELKDTNRPDLWSVEGIARELKGYFNIETGIPKYQIEEGDKIVYVDEEIKKIRPYIACAIVKDVKLGEEGFESLIQLQEKLAQNYGRKRRKVAIGTSIYDKIKFPVYYKAVDPEKVSFVPLNEIEEMNLREILVKTEKGKEYGWILESYDKYPILIDSDNKVISFPPIINSNDIGKISPETKNIFVDVTGTDLESVLLVLNVIVTALAERGGRIEKVTIQYPDGSISTPSFKSQTMIVDVHQLKRLSGLNLDLEDIKELLKRKRYNISLSEDYITVTIPFYRRDVMSIQDIVEDLLISYGFDRIEPKPIRVPTVGSELKIKKFIDLLREILISLKYVEMRDPIITSDISQTELLKLEDKDKLVYIENPVSNKYNVLRKSLIPQLLESFSFNKKYSHPQKLFEVGETVRLENEKVIEDINLCMGISDSKITITDLISDLNALFKNLGLEVRYYQENVPFFVEGRSATIKIGEEKIGIVGEVSPEVILKFGYDFPTVIAEINVKKLFKLVF